MKEIIKKLSHFTTKERFDLFEKIILYRTRYLSVLIEDVYSPHNASAILRSCDLFGIQDVHIVENKNKFTLSKGVALGSSKWLNLINHNQSENNTIQAINKLKSDGYKIVATVPQKDAQLLEEFDITDSPRVIMFGTELQGLSDIAIENADEFLKIPQFGFTESFNISVAVAVIMHHLSWKMKQQNINWELSDVEKDEILIDWLKKSVKNADKIINKFFK